MSPKFRVKVQNFNLELSNNSWKSFLDLLRVIEVSNSSRPLSNIIRLFERGDIIGGYEEADSLSKQSYLTPAEHFAANQVAYLIKKYPFPESINPFDPEREAKDKFRAAEIRCSETNTWFRSSFRGNFEQKIQKMRSYIRYVIGDKPDLAKIYSRCAFGPGASIGVNGNATNLGRKFQAENWSVSPGAYHYVRSSMAGISLIHELISSVRTGPFFEFSFDSFARDFELKTKVVDYNKIAFVPKTAKTYRSIAVEPLLNTWIQKGTDLVLRDYLKRVGIDLSDQSINSELARQGSLREQQNPFCTIDLSSASDSISIELVRNLLPPDWFDFLNSTRSQNYIMDGVIHRYEKFCSMGNGFCFPLETLIFAAACKAVNSSLNPRTDFVVYGDDIIIRQNYATELIELLDKIGFATNSDKTFIEGPFRESCGRDWFDGEDVRPFVLDFALDSHQALNKFCNLTLRNERCKMFFREARDLIMSWIPPDILFVRPEVGSAEGAITVALDQFMSSRFAKFSTNLQTWTWQELSSLACEDIRMRRSSLGVTLTIAALHGVSSHQPYTVRRKTRTRVTRMCHS